MLKLHSFTSYSLSLVKTYLRINQNKHTLPNSCPARLSRYVNSLLPSSSMILDKQIHCNRDRTSLDEGYKTLTVGHCISSNFDNSRKTMTSPCQTLLVRGCTTAIITAHAPGQHMWPSPGLGPTLSAPD